jgi:hypothetical protein
MTNLGLTTASVLVTATSLYLDDIDCIIYQDMVDTTPFSQAEPSLRADLIIKVVLGAINDSLDNTMVPQSVLQY